MMKISQQDFLRDAAQTLGISQKNLAKRMTAPWTTFQKWLMPEDSLNKRDMPEIAWQLVREILEHEKLKEYVQSMPKKKPRK